MKTSALVFLLFTGLVSAASISGVVYDSNLDKIDKAVIELVGASSTQVKVTRNGSYWFEAPSGDYFLLAKTAESADNELNQSIILVAGTNTAFDLVLLGLNKEPMAPETDFLEEISSESINETQLTELDNLDEGGRKNANYYYWAFGGLLVLVAAIAYWTWFRKPVEKQAAPDARAEKKGSGQDEPLELHRKERNALEAQRKEMNALEAQRKELELHREERDVLEFIEKNGGSATQRELRKALPYSESKVSMVLTNLEGLGKLRKTKRGRGNVIRLK